MHPTVQVELIKQLGALLSALLLVGAGLYLILRFRNAFGDFFRRLSEFSLKTPAGEFSAKAAAETSALLGAAQAAQREDSGPGQSPAPVREIKADAVAESVRVAAHAAHRLRNRTILWVDDNPHNNTLISRAIEALGVRIETAKSTEEGLRCLQTGHFDLTITDLTRGSDGEAGLKFIQQARAVDPRRKIIVYSSRRGVHKYPRAYELGAVAATYDPSELFDRVVLHLGG